MSLRKMERGEKLALRHVRAALAEVKRINIDKVESNGIADNLVLLKGDAADLLRRAERLLTEDVASHDNDGSELP